MQRQILSKLHLPVRKSEPNCAAWRVRVIAWFAKGHTDKVVWGNFYARDVWTEPVSPTAQVHVTNEKRDTTPEHRVPLEAASLVAEIERYEVESEVACRSLP
ncbi:hypothetical protein [Burkholderia pseudomallei]|uniref:hypothetical protein n=1 Tax=Burkholderia pseudomallei TaxID=28450 RepID=UPI000F253CDC|nr:hypothetical protein [Burkholderia pseudomallei]MBF3650904.1 hypothetical protein [Burkholderia pseudomallei]MBF3668916.1 hypothetical protein [Burkholderia pseudomallei]MBF3774373.1 hypothetical protein [Burkholderia pseudomallei]MBF3873407.1 hypothetical protein [Burkholderia pseudomallei]MBF3907678.1 hypothetical protein [Burkholderia pseudomallei]